MKKLTEEEAIVACYKADNEGLAYAIQEGYLDYPGTVLEGPVKKAKAALEVVEQILNTLRELHDIDGPESDYVDPDEDLESEDMLDDE